MTCTHCGRRTDHPVIALGKPYGPVCARKLGIGRKARRPAAQAKHVKQSRKAAQPVQRKPKPRPVHPDQIHLFTEVC